MKDGFIRVAAATPDLRVADVAYNREQIKKQIEEGAKKQVKVMVFPELCLTGYTCSDLFWQSSLVDEAKRQLFVLSRETMDYDMLIFVGLPWEKDHHLYNVMAAMCRGRLLGFVPKRYLPNHGEFYEARQFQPGNEEVDWVLAEEIPGDKNRVPFGSKLLFACETIPMLWVGAEVCEDLWVPKPPSISHALAGATLIVNGSASDEVLGKEDYRRSLVQGQSARLICGYLYADAGEGESTTDMVFGGHNIIAENGTILKESRRFQNGIITADLDLERIRSERRRMTTFGPMGREDYFVQFFSMKPDTIKIERGFAPNPFVPEEKQDREKRCEEILSIQSVGLKKRLRHTGCKSAVVGISGGLDSTLALLVTARAFDMLGLSREGITAVTMPCFGTTDRTYENACELAGRLGVSLREVNIKEAVRLHFRDIGQQEEMHDVTYENSQARERTQILMDLANQTGGLVIGTGDMSELALGWSTYNGDHMSMYGVNASVPKTLVRHLVRYVADTCEDEKLSQVLLDILDTPVSPELLPPSHGQISQKTEDIVGPYELHDFFLYYMMRFGYHPGKIYRMARLAFSGVYEKEEIKKWLTVFYTRFFSQQFKRSCMPDGPKVGSVALSPRGDLRMPSDACGRIWLEELKRLQ